MDQRALSYNQSPKLLPPGLKVKGSLRPDVTLVWFSPLKLQTPVCEQSLSSEWESSTTDQTPFATAAYLYLLLNDYISFTQVRCERHAPGRDTQKKNHNAGTGSGEGKYILDELIRSYVEYKTVCGTYFASSQEESKESVKSIQDTLLLMLTSQKQKETMCWLQWKETAALQEMEEIGE